MKTIRLVVATGNLGGFIARRLLVRGHGAGPQNFAAFQEHAAMPRGA